MAGFDPVGAGSTPAPGALIGDGFLKLSLECGGGTRRFERRGWGSIPHRDISQERAPGRAIGLQNRPRGFESFRSCLQWLFVTLCDAAGVAI